MNPAQNMLVKAMLNPAFYGRVDRVELVETHISWIFLAGDFAYKLKKPLDLGFLDFSTLERRRHFCQEELRLNRRFAPQLYLEVIRIGGSSQQPQPGGTPAIDYAVKMKRFPARQQLDRIQAEGQLTALHIDRFATMIAQQHEQAPVVEKGQDFGSPAAIMTPARQNFVQLKPLLPLALEKQVKALEHWSEQAGQGLEALLQARKERGFIRECHGDVHLGNMAWFEGEPILFDCIEFSENLRWIDTINDIAFLVMDLDDRGEETFGWRFLNRYLRETGDYPGMKLLDFYKVYRAMVRAKVISMRLSQADLVAEERDEAQRLAQSYLSLAAGYTEESSPRLIITHGFSGSGKTTFVSELAPLCRAVCVHSDVERKRLHNLPATAASHSRVGGGLYGEDATAATYRRLHDLADELLSAGMSTIIDATFIKQAPRKMIRQLAERHQVPLIVLDFPLAAAELERRVARRSGQSGQISEATAAVLHHQRAQAEPLGCDEGQAVLQVPPDLPVARVAKLVAGRGQR